MFESLRVVLATATRGFSEPMNLLMVLLMVLLLMVLLMVLLLMVLLLMVLLMVLLPVLFVKKMMTDLASSSSSV